MKTALKKLGIILGVIVLAWVIGITAGLILNKNSESVIGSVLIAISSVMLIVGNITFIVVLVKAITQRAFRKQDIEHKQPYEKTYTEIQSSFQGKSRSSQHKTYTYNRRVVADNLNWPVLITLIVILPPLGVYFSIKKIVLESTDYYKNGTRLSVIGGVYIVFSLLSIAFAALNWINEKQFSDAVFLEIVFSGLITAFSLLIFVSGLCLRHIGFMYDKLLYLITAEKITNIDELSAAMKMKKSKTIDKVMFLIDNSMLCNAYYYPYDNEIIVAGISKKIAQRCKSCASTTVFYSNDKDHKCVYCGATL